MLDWTSKRVYDLPDDVDLRMLYETVIREAMRVEELRKCLDPVLLSAVWQRLWLTLRARLMWEGRFPQLARRAGGQPVDSHAGPCIGARCCTLADVLR